MRRPASRAAAQPPPRSHRGQWPSQGAMPGRTSRRQGRQHPSALRGPFARRAAVAAAAAADHGRCARSRRKCARWASPRSGPRWGRAWATCTHRAAGPAQSARSAPMLRRAPMRRWPSPRQRLRLRRRRRRPCCARSVGGAAPRSLSHQMAEGWPTSPADFPCAVPRRQACRPARPLRASFPLPPWLRCRAPRRRRTGRRSGRGMRRRAGAWAGGAARAAPAGASAGSRVARPAGAR
mmetsp:Transcript_70964/g.207962  ORF Transcript_70964/g.207962 Transcript_70964/m.207962 type:complete len:237 (+) Transcript_70964:695-1405(+)